MCFVSISGAQELLSLMGWELGEAERPAELGCGVCLLCHTLLFASALDIPKLSCLGQILL